ncbi:hypothetical protein GCM10007061_16630 [Kocuria marina]|nr:hypothetical protein GCM10007061_16630 [Kocuria marina]
MRGSRESPAVPEAGSPSSQPGLRRARGASSRARLLRLRCVSSGGMGSLVPRFEHAVNSQARRAPELYDETVTEDVMNR